MSSSLEDLQCIAVRKVDVSSASKTSTTHPRVGRLQSHRFSSTTERTMQADLCCSRAPQAVLQGAPLDCSSGLTAAQPGPWLRPAAYSPSQTDKTDQVKPPDSGHPRLIQTKETNLDTTPPPEEDKNRGGGARTGVPWGAKRLQALVTLVSAPFSFATQPTSINNVGKLTEETLANIWAPDFSRLSEGREDWMKRRKAPKTKEHNHNHTRSRKRGRREGRRGQERSIPNLLPRMATV